MIICLSRKISNKTGKRSQVVNVVCSRNSIDFNELKYVLLAPFFG